MDFSSIHWDVVVSGVLLILSAVLAFRVSKAKKLLKELAGALTTLSDAIADDNVSGEELISIRAEFMHVILAAKDLIGK